MVRHTCSSPLVEVLGSFGINGLRENSHVKYWAIRCVTGMRVDMGCDRILTYGKLLDVLW